MYIYNPSSLYTLLFKGGNLEIKPKRAILATEADLLAGIFEQAKLIKNVEQYEREEDLPPGALDDPYFPSVIGGKELSNSVAEMLGGMTEDELKQHLSKPESTVKSTAKVTPIGSKETEVDESTREGEPTESSPSAEVGLSPETAVSSSEDTLAVLSQDNPPARKTRTKK